jgi:hypothetical protein
VARITFPIGLPIGDDLPRLAAALIGESKYPVVPPSFQKTAYRTHRGFGAAAGAEW